MRRMFLIGLAVGACGGDDGPTGPITARITHYDYSFDIDTRAAVAKVTATIDVGGDCLTLPFRSKGLIAEGMKIDGAPMRSVSIADDTIVMCGSGYPTGAEVTFESAHEIPLETLSTSQVGYSITTAFPDTDPFYYLVSWVGGCDRFGPCDNRPDQFATYTFHVAHPAGFTARCPGTVTEVSPTETQCDFTADGGPTYSTFGVAAYPAWTQTPKGKWGSVDVTVYDKAGVIETALDTTFHSGFVAFMEQSFGAFPFGSELRILTAPTYWSGFEHPGNIVLDTKLNGPSSYADPVAHVTNHEIAHQWAGDQTTLADTYDFVWKEAMAEYLAYVYEDGLDGTVGNQTAEAWKDFSNGARFFPVPGEKPELFDYYGDVYGPGPMILFRQLEVLTSRELVIAALKTVLGQPRALSVDEVIAALEASTGLELDAYAAAWVHGTGEPVWPSVALTFTPGAGTSSLRVQQMTALERTCKFRVALNGANPGQSVEVEVDTFHNGTDQTLSVTTPAFEVVDTVLDPKHECLVFRAQTATVAPKSPRSHPWRAGHLAP